jgi:hypothetical protein
MRAAEMVLVGGKNMLVAKVIRNAQYLLSEHF